MLLVPDEGECGSLYCHFAKHNQHYRDIEGQTVLSIFTGPHSYISPYWYAGKPNVPTWNYAAVHATGKAELLDQQQTSDVIYNTLVQYEAKLLKDTQMLPTGYQHKLNNAIVGCKITLSDLRGINKLGQHRKMDDQRGIYRALVNHPNASAVALGKYMHKLGFVE